MTERLDIEVSRNETWRDTIDLPYRGGPLPLTGATVAMQWRLFEGAPGDALIDLPNVGYIDFRASTENPNASADLRILRLFPIVSQDVLEGLPTGLNQPEPGEADRYTWDVIIHYADGATERPVAGFAYLKKGTTRG
jgi:hypothetical protein